MRTNSVFCDNVKAELLADIPRKPCCRQAFLLGLLFRSDIDGNEISADFSSVLVADCLLSLLPGNENGIEDTVECHHRVFRIRFRQKRLPELLAGLSEESALSDLIKKPCEDCRKYYLAGVFLAAGHVTVPKKSNHLEIKTIRIPEGRIGFLLSVAEQFGIVFKRDKNGRVYLKSNQAIGDFLSGIGALSAGFQVADAYIEKDFRNAENRATNCVARNISKSVSASERDINAIRLILTEIGEEHLPRELRSTAELRLTNAELTLTELGRLHSPALTKSGVRHRLDKVVAIAEELTEKKKLANSEKL